MSRSQHAARRRPPVWLSPTEWSALERFVDEVRARDSDRVHRMTLFGSRARGEGHEESDLDVAVILTGDDHALRRALIDLATGIYLDTGIKISPLVLSQRDFNTLAQMERGIAVAIQHEGVDL